jgi:hypothetical protein
MKYSLKAPVIRRTPELAQVPRAICSFAKCYASSSAASVWSAAIQRRFDFPA